MVPDYDIRRIEVIDEQTAEMYRRMSPGQRLRIGLRAHGVAKRAIEAGVRSRNPAWNDKEVRQEVLRRLSGGSN
jgi:hypothetical protein